MTIKPTYLPYIQTNQSHNFQNHHHHDPYPTNQQQTAPIILIKQFSTLHKDPTLTFLQGEKRTTEQRSPTRERKKERNSVLIGRQKDNNFYGIKPGILVANTTPPVTHPPPPSSHKSPPRDARTSLSASRNAHFRSSSSAEPYAARRSVPGGDVCRA